MCREKVVMSSNKWSGVRRTAAYSIQVKTLEVSWNAVYYCIVTVTIVIVIIIVINTVIITTITIISMLLLRVSLLNLVVNITGFPFIVSLSLPLRVKNKSHIALYSVELAYVEPSGGHFNKCGVLMSSLWF